jgi:hypothetical protein
LPNPNGQIEKCNDFRPSKEDTNGPKWKRQDSDWEPSTFHGMKMQVPSEMLHAYTPGGVIDFTPAGGEWAMCCILERCPYLGVCYTDEHAEMLRFEGTNQHNCLLMPRQPRKISSAKCFD